MLVVCVATPCVPGGLVLVQPPHVPHPSRVVHLPQQLNPIRAKVTGGLSCFAHETFAVNGQLHPEVNDQPLLCPQQLRRYVLVVDRFLLLPPEQPHNLVEQAWWRVLQRVLRLPVVRLVVLVYRLRVLVAQHAHPEPVVLPHRRGRLQAVVVGTALVVRLVIDVPGCAVVLLLVRVRLCQQPGAGVLRRLEEVQVALQLRDDKVGHVASPQLSFQAALLVEEVFVYNSFDLLDHVVVEEGGREPGSYRSHRLVPPHRPGVEPDPVFEASSVLVIRLQIFGHLIPYSLLPWPRHGPPQSLSLGAGKKTARTRRLGFTASALHPTVPGWTVPRCPPAAETFR